MKPETDVLISRILLYGGLAGMAVTITLELLGFFKDLGILLTFAFGVASMAGYVRGASQKDLAELGHDTRTGLRELRQTTLAGFADLKETTQAGFADLKATTQAGFADLKATTQAGFADLKETTQAGFHDLRSGQAETNGLLRIIAERLGGRGPASP